MRTFFIKSIFVGMLALGQLSPARAQTLDQSIAAAKSEKELSFIAGPTTFGYLKGGGAKLNEELVKLLKQ